MIMVRADIVEVESVRTKVYGTDSMTFITAEKNNVLSAANSNINNYNEIDN
jgi:hypothetical protein